MKKAPVYAGVFVSIHYLDCLFGRDKRLSKNLTLDSNRPSNF